MEGKNEPVNGPAYLKIVIDLGRKIREGEIRPGAMLPSIPQLEDQYMASTGVVRRALQSLRHERLIRTEPGVGSFVTDPSSWTTAEAAELMQLLGELRDEIREIREENRRRFEAIEQRLK